jgi:hypothetical protein
MLAGLTSRSQGKVVINEYLPWTSNGCGATAEFVELMNYGPGPMNIGCYILTDGDYSVTIPANTILQPGEFYVISGQDVIPSGCANIDSLIHSDLNWNTCGCTNAPIPTTGDGFFTDGGNANEQVVLLDPTLHVVDAVVRSYPMEPSSLITTSANGCAPQTFDLDLMNINYETLGMSTGRGNSFARTLDGDCGWVKDPQQSGGATNNTPGETSDVSYSLTIVKSMDCDTSHGTIDIFVNVGVFTGPLFPMNYMIAFDSNRDGVFNFLDTYYSGTDSTPPSVAITGLPLGRYKVTVGSVLGCFLKTFDITILDCTAVLPVQLVWFRLAGEKARELNFEWMVQQTEDIESCILEQSLDGRRFTRASALEDLHLSGTRVFSQWLRNDGQASYYRLKLNKRNGATIYSSVIRTGSTQPEIHSWPNPAKNEIFLDISGLTATSAYEIFDQTGRLVLTGTLTPEEGGISPAISVSKLPSGIYLGRIKGAEHKAFRFVKH